MEMGRGKRREEERGQEPLIWAKAGDSYFQESVRDQFRLHKQRSVRSNCQVQKKLGQMAFGPDSNLKKKKNQELHTYPTYMYHLLSIPVT